MGGHCGGILAPGLGVLQFDTSQVDDVNGGALNVYVLAQLIDLLTGWVWNVVAHFPSHSAVSKIQELWNLAKNHAVLIHGMWPADSNWPRDVPSRYNDKVDGAKLPLEDITNMIW